MSRPDSVPWHEYLRGYSRLKWRSAGDQQRYQELTGLTQPLCALLHGNLLDSTVPKIVFGTPTPKPVQDKGHAPFTFKLQCLVTGRVSRAIPYERLIEFGVFSYETRYPFGHQAEKLDIKDRISPLLARLQTEISAVAPYWDSPGLTWHERYAEYLCSDEWLALRQRVLKRDRHRCTISGKSSRPDDPLQVHHLTYVRVGREDMDDLITVCRSAHRQLHQGKF